MACGLLSQASSRRLELSQQHRCFVSERPRHSPTRHAHLGMLAALPRHAWHARRGQCRHIMGRCIIGCCIVCLRSPRPRPIRIRAVAWRLSYVPECGAVSAIL